MLNSQCGISFQSFVNRIVYLNARIFNYVKISIASDAQDIPAEHLIFEDVIDSFNSPRIWIYNGDPAIAGPYVINLAGDSTVLLYNSKESDVKWSPYSEPGVYIVEFEEKGEGGVYFPHIVEFQVTVEIFSKRLDLILLCDGANTDALHLTLRNQTPQTFFDVLSARLADTLSNTLTAGFETIEFKDGQKIDFPPAQNERLEFQLGLLGLKMESLEINQITDIEDTQALSIAKESRAVIATESEEFKKDSLKFKSDLSDLTEKLFDNASQKDVDSGIAVEKFDDAENKPAEVISIPKPGDAPLPKPVPPSTVAPSISVPVPPSPGTPSMDITTDETKEERVTVAPESVKSIPPAPSSSAELLIDSSVDEEIEEAVAVAPEPPKAMSAPPKPPSAVAGEQSIRTDDPLTESKAHASDFVLPPLPSVAAITPQASSDESSPPVNEKHAKKKRMPTPRRSARKRTVSAKHSSADLNELFPEEPTINLEVESLKALKFAKVEWFNKMILNRVYPLIIRISTQELVASKKQVSIVTGEEKSEVAQKITLDLETPVIVRPEFPGCLVMPSERIIEPAIEQGTLTFFITSLAKGKMQNQIVFQQKTKIQASILLEGEVIDHRLAKWLAYIGSAVGAIPAVFAFVMGQSIGTFFTSRLGNLFGNFAFISEVIVTLGLLGSGGYLFYKNNQISSTITQSQISV